MRRIWGSSWALAILNVVMSTLVVLLWSSRGSGGGGGCSVRPADPSTREDLGYHGTLAAAMAVFDFMRAHKEGRVVPEELDVVGRQVELERCWRGGPERPGPSADDWALVGEDEGERSRELYLFRAYLDGRESPLFPEARGVVQLLAMVRRRLEGPLFCQLWAEDAEEPVVLRAYYREIWQRPWDPRNRFYSPYLITCPLPSSFKEPHSVSISFNPCPKRLHNIREVFGASEAGKSAAKEEVAVCVKGVDFSSDEPDKLVEWLELQFLLGASKVQMYTYAVGRESERVLRRYEAAGRVEVTRLSLPGTTPRLPLPRSRFVWRNRQQKRRNEIIPYNDCLYRHLASHHFVLILDLDEVVVPQPPLQDWSQLLARLRETVGPWTAYVAPNAFFFPNLTRPGDMDPGLPVHHFFLRHHVRSAKVSPSGSYGKSFVNTSAAATVFNHYPLHKQHPDFRRTHYIKPQLALKLHFKEKCPVESRDECPSLYANTVSDPSLKRYERQLIDRVTQVRRTLQL